MDKTKIRIRDKHPGSATLLTGSVTLFCRIVPYLLYTLGQDFELCIRAENVVLPKSGYFGVSAATGGLADDHDVLKFITHSLRSPDLSLGRLVFGKPAADRCSIILGIVWVFFNKTARRHDLFSSH
jgi:hypothetical protein